MREEDLEELKETVVFYHGQCLDGFTAAWAAWKKFGDNASYIPLRHGEADYKIASEVKNSNVYVLDFSFPKEYIEKLTKNNRSFTLLDHHVSAMKDLDGVANCYFDMKRSGAGISWDYFHPNVRRPKLVDYVEDRDLWNNKFPYIEEAAAFVETFDREFSKWTELDAIFEISFETVINTGSSLKKYKEIHVDRACHKALKVELLGIEAICVNSADFQSEVGNKLSKETDTFVIVWHQISDGNYRYSLRSNQKKGMDVSEIAKVFGGGGHKNAAAFTSKKIEFTII